MILRALLDKKKIEKNPRMRAIRNGEDSARILTFWLSVRTEREYTWLAVVTQWPSAARPVCQLIRVCLLESD